MNTRNDVLARLIANTIILLVGGGIGAIAGDGVNLALIFFGVAAVFAGVGIFLDIWSA